MADDPVLYPKCQTELMAALAETDSNKLLERVKEAEKAITKHLGEFHGVPLMQQRLRLSKRQWTLWRYSGERSVSRKHPESVGTRFPRTIPCIFGKTAAPLETSVLLVVIM